MEHYYPSRSLEDTDERQLDGLLACVTRIEERRAAALAAVLGKMFGGKS